MKVSRGELGKMTSHIIQRFSSLEERPASS